MRRALPLAVLLLAGEGSAQVEVIPKVGVDFEHFGETYRLTADRDTVSTINDYGTLVGLTVRSAPFADDRFRVDADFHLGKETRRLRLDFEGRLRRGDHAFELDHEGLYRIFAAGGDYSISSDYLQEYLRVGWERRIGERVRVRVRDVFDVTWYREPSEYNLNTWTHRPGMDVRVGFGDLSETRLGYRFGRRTVPDSTSLDYRRHTVEGDLSLLFGWTASLDVSAQLDRRLYDEASVRESSWENRVDATVAFDIGDRTSLRLIHENEVVRFDEPDELDFDFEWIRTGLQVEIHQSRSVDIALMPIYAFLASSTAPEEEYSETGIEVAIDWRIGSSTWINLSDEIGRRDYEISADPIGDLVLDDIAADLGDGSIFSDYIYNRLTLLVTSEVTRGVSVNLFANWQPENHRVNSHDTDTRIISGGIEYRF